MNLLILSFVSFLPLFDDFSTQFFTSTTMNGIHSDTALELLELLLNFRALCLLLIELILKFTSHAIITILSLFQVVTDLMHISKCVKILVLM